MIQTDDGPYDLISRFRAWVGVRYIDGIPAGQSVVAKAIMCHWCLSVWVGLLLAWMVNPVNIHGYLASALALSGASVLIEGALERLGRE